MKWKRRLYVLVAAVALAVASYATPLDALTVYPDALNAKAGEASSIQYNPYFFSNMNPIPIYLMVYIDGKMLWQGVLMKNESVGPIMIPDGAHFTVWQQSRTTLEEHFTGFTSKKPNEGYDFRRIKIMGHMDDMDRKGA